MAITYEKLAEISCRSGIDVVVQFTNGRKTKNKIFFFKDQDEIDNNYTAKMEKAIQNFIDDREREITPQEFMDKLKKYFSNNTILTREQVITFLSTKIVVEDTI